MVRWIEEVLFGENRFERVVRKGVEIATVIARMPMRKARVLKLDVAVVGCVVFGSDG